ncbi:MAG: hypothetical protein JKY13_01290, partial [Gammaproteobacteria bacterium]|nr:hypothetical protein [Gammaproteobacteria bacterium]
KEGYEIIKLLAKQPQQVEPFKQVQAIISKAYRQQKAQQQFAEHKEQLANLSFENPNSLQEAAAQLHLVIHTTPWFTQQGSQGVLAYPQVIKVAFGEEVQAGSNSDIILPKPGVALVIRMIKHQVATVKPLSQVSVAIKQTLLQQAMRNKALTIATHIAQQIQQGKRAKTLLQQYQLQWKAPMTVRRNQKKFDKQILQAVFTLPRPSVKHTRVKIVSLNVGDAAVVMVSQVNESKLQLNKKQQQHYRQQLQSTLSQLTLAELRSYYRKQAKMTIKK